MERTVIEGLTPGTAQVYLYENGDHVKTMIVTVNPPVPSISVEDWSVTLKLNLEINTIRNTRWVLK